MDTGMDVSKRRIHRYAESLGRQGIGQRLIELYRTYHVPMLSSGLALVRIWKPKCLSRLQDAICSTSSVPGCGTRGYLPARIPANASLCAIP